MPNRKMKEESYSNLGGINVKASPYITGPQQFLDIKNFDFQVPGSLSQRWGSTQFTSQGFSFPVNSVFDFARLDGASYVLTGVSGALYFGATTGVAAAATFGAASSTFVGVIAIDYLRGAAPSAVISADGYFRDNQNIRLRPFDPGEFATSVITIPANLMAQNRNDFVSFSDNAFFCDGQKFMRFSGSSFLAVSLPYLQYGPGPVTGAVGFTTAPSSTQGFGYSGVLAFAAAYVNDRGFEGPLTPFAVLPVGSLTASMIATLGGGSSFFNITKLIGVPSYYPIRSINFYSYFFNLTLTSNQFSFPVAFFATLWQTPWRFLQNTIVSNATTTFGLSNSSGVTFMQFSTTNFGFTLITQIINNAGPVYLDKSYDMLTGVTFVGPRQQQYAQIGAFPSFMEVYQNRLAMAGFSGLPSSVALSDINEPEGYPEDLVFEVRTNDSDRVTALKAYNQRLYVFKNRSFHELSGDDESNFAVRQVSSDYGCLNNRCVETYSNAQGEFLFFLDTQGVMKFNGAMIQPLSNEIQPIFQSMNFTAAVQSALVTHDKQRNQLLVSIPVNGATLNNLTAVYDYLVGAWTTYAGYTPTSYAVLRSRFNLPTLAYGSHSGLVQYFGPSFASDNGVGFTCTAKTRFLRDLGQTTEKQWRRLWLNIDESQGATVPIEVKMRQDYGTSVIYSVTMPVAPFQNRIDYGIPAKALSFEFYKFSATTLIKMHGFGVAYRYQRDV